MILSGKILLPHLMILLCFLEKIDAVIHSGPKLISSANSYGYSEQADIQKVILTQKGYIQFLKYTADVPPLTDYTFCIWLRSHNLTYNHPIFSYSKHEEERLIRVWVSEKGENLRLEILDHQIFKIPVNLEANIWYHICQSWSSPIASWDLYINGKLKSTGAVPKLTGVPIKGGGDIVVGQEYTDFDKGLDDGIEGDIFGFNFVLSSTLTSGRHQASPVKRVNYPIRRRFDNTKFKPHSHAGKTPIYHRHANYHQGVGLRFIGGHNYLNKGKVLSMSNSEFRASSALVYDPQSRFKRSVFQDAFDLFNAELQTSYLPSPITLFNRISTDNYRLKSRTISNEFGYENPKTLGLLLVDLSFDCGLRKGAPLSGKGVLISWTKSEVRVFGGAILKKIPPFCKIGNSL